MGRMLVPGKRRSSAAGHHNHEEVRRRASSALDNMTAPTIGIDPASSVILIPAFFPTQASTWAIARP